MQTMFNIGDSVFIKGTVRWISINREGVINYDLEIDGDVYTCGTVRVSEKDIEEIQKEREEK